MRSDCRRTSQNYFYAESDADSYDLVAPLTERTYDDVHEILIELMDHYLKLREERHGEAGFSVLDLGAGTGAEAIRILQRWKHGSIVAVDRAGPMLNLLSDKLAQKPELENRIKTLLLDFSKVGETLQRDLLAPLAQWPHFSPDHYDAVVSVFALHHLTSEKKLGLYRALRQVLPPDGVFINGDLFSYATHHLAKLAQEIEEKWLEGKFEELAAQPSQLVNFHGTDTNYLEKEWIRHLREDNRPLPISDCRFLAPLVSETEQRRIAESESFLLIKAGFREVECVFRRFQAGLIWARA